MVLMFTWHHGRSKGVMLCERNCFAVMPHVQVGQRFCQLKNDRTCWSAT